MKKLSLLLLAFTLSFGSAYSEDWSKEVTDSLIEITKAAEEGVKASITVDQCEVDDETLLDFKASATLKGAFLNTSAELEYHHADLSPVKPDLHIKISATPALINLESIYGLNKKTLALCFFGMLEDEGLDPSAFELSIPKWEASKGFLTNAEIILKVDFTLLDLDEDDSLFTDATLRITIKDRQVTVELDANICDAVFIEEINEEIGYLELLKNRDPEFISCLQIYFDELCSELLEMEQNFIESQNFIQL